MPTWWRRLSIKQQVAIAIVAAWLLSGVLTFMVRRYVIHEHFRSVAQDEVRRITKTIDNVYRGYQHKTISLLATLSSDHDLRLALASGNKAAVLEVLKARSTYLQVNGDYGYIELVAAQMDVPVSLGLNPTPHVQPDLKDASSRIVCEPAGCFLQNAIPVFRGEQIVGQLIGSIPLTEVLANLSTTSGVEIHSPVAGAQARPAAENGGRERVVALAVSEAELRKVQPYFVQDISVAAALSEEVNYPAMAIAISVSGLLVTLVMLTINKPLTQIRSAIEAMDRQDWTDNSLAALVPMPSAADVSDINRLLAHHIETRQRYIEEQAHRLAAADKAKLAEGLAQQKTEYLKRSTLDFEVERKEIARELHDFYGQHLVSAKLDASTLKRIGKDNPAIQEVAERIIESVQLMYTGVADIMDRLQPPELESVGLVAAIRNMVHRWKKIRPEISFDYAIEEVVEQAESSVKATLYRVVQESITNAMKYAQPHELRLRISGLDGEVLVELADDGVGFDVATIAAGNGLRGMRERVEALGGEFVLASAPGEGTRIRCRIPCLREQGLA